MKCRLRLHTLIRFTGYTVKTEQVVRKKRQRNSEAKRAKEKVQA